MKDDLKFRINEIKFTWHEQYITGPQVRQIGNIPDDENLYLQIKKPWEDELIENETKVDLARPGLERFYSQNRDVRFHVKLIINAREVDWHSRIITYLEVVKLADPTFVDSGDSVYTVTYIDGPGQNPEGSLSKGDKVFVKNKMKFNVTKTNRS